MLEWEPILPLSALPDMIPEHKIYGLLLELHPAKCLLTGHLPNIFCQITECSHLLRFSLICKECWLKGLHL